jgi:hypothetical protein
VTIYSLNSTSLTTNASFADAFRSRFVAAVAAAAAARLTETAIVRESPGLRGRSTDVVFAVHFPLRPASDASAYAALLVEEYADQDNTVPFLNSAFPEYAVGNVRNVQQSVAVWVHSPPPPPPSPSPPLPSPPPSPPPLPPPPSPPPPPPYAPPAPTRRNDAADVAVVVGVGLALLATAGVGVGVLIPHLWRKAMARKLQAEGLLMLESGGAGAAEDHKSRDGNNGFKSTLRISLGSPMAGLSALIGSPIKALTSPMQALSPTKVAPSSPRHPHVKSILHVSQPLDAIPDAAV